MSPIIPNIVHLAARTLHLKLTTKKITSLKNWGKVLKKKHALGVESPLKYLKNYGV